jgi:hypothetical protein
MCPITRQGYDNEIEPRLNYLSNKWDLSSEEIFEYLLLQESLEELKYSEENHQDS